MEIGFLTDLRRTPFTTLTWSAHYARMLEVIEEIDHLRGDGIFLAEHHFAEDGYIPQPLTFAAAIAARTQHVRIGTSVLIAPVRHPLHIAEEVAVIDVLSDGRVELGMGAGYAPSEFAAFDVERANRFDLLDSRVADVRRMLREVVSPAPVQDEVPIWCGYLAPTGARRAGRLGEGLLTLERRCHEPYLEGLREGGHDPKSAKMAGVMTLMLAEDPERTRVRLEPHIDYHARQYQRYFDEVAVYEGREPSSGASPGHLLDVLTPDEAVATIRSATDGLPAKRVILWLSVGGMPDDLVEEHVTLTLTKVAPALRSAGQGATDQSDGGAHGPAA